MTISQNTLFYGDNLDVLRQDIPTESVNLIYIDPPFNSNRSYNVLFGQKQGEAAQAQIEAFNDTWSWTQDSDRQYREMLAGGVPNRVADAIEAMRRLIGENDLLAYLVMMTPRLVELRRVLKPTGSIYLHCDPTASHYLKLIMDAIFGQSQFRNEIIWKRSSAHNDARQGSQHYGRITDTILFYGNGRAGTWNTQYVPYDQSYVDGAYRHTDPDGRRYRTGDLTGPGGAAKGNPFYEVLGVSRFWRYSKEKMDELIRTGRVVQSRPGTVPWYKRYLDEMPGVSVQSLWSDIQVINPRAVESLGYPTQKPRALLERIIKTSSNPGDVVLDPFCGCGTAIDAAQHLGRRWIGIDITYIAVYLTQKRLHARYTEKIESTFEVRGIPRDLSGIENTRSRLWEPNTKCSS